MGPLRKSGEQDWPFSRRYADGTQQHVERAAVWAAPGLCIRQRQNQSVCAVLGAQTGATALFSSPEPSFAADSGR